MTDIDFDELDKAVNNLMADVDTSKRPAGLDDPVDTVVSLGATNNTSTSTPVTVPAPVASSSDQLTPASDSAIAVSEESVAVSPALAVKRRGQFMDVMHPSSDMKALQGVSRQGMPLSPVARTVAADATSSVVSSSADDMTTETVTAPAVDEVDISPTTPEAYVDNPTGESTHTEDVSAVPSEAESSHEPELSESAIDENAEPSTVVDPSHETDLEAELASAEAGGSPFLPDAKVEKRPLGTPAEPSDEMIEPVNETNSADSEASAVDQSASDEAPEETSAPDVHLPEELHSDVVSIESSVSQPGEEVSDSPVVTETLAAMAGTGSINQQYAEQTPTGDQTSGAIFDTASYHQPLEASASTKKKGSSVLKFIVWTLVLVIVGALAGAAYFYFTTR